MVSCCSACHRKISGAKDADAGPGVDLRARRAKFSTHILSSQRRFLNKLFVRGRGEERPYTRYIVNDHNAPGWRLSLPPGPCSGATLVDVGPDDAVEGSPVDVTRDDAARVLSRYRHIYESVPRWKELVPMIIQHFDLDNQSQDAEATVDEESVVPTATQPPTTPPTGVTTQTAPPVERTAMPVVVAPATNYVVSPFDSASTLLGLAPVTAKITPPAASVVAPLAQAPAPAERHVDRAPVPQALVPMLVKGAPAVERTDDQQVAIATLGGRSGAGGVVADAAVEERLRKMVRRHQREMRRLRQAGTRRQAGEAVGFGHGKRMASKVVSVRSAPAQAAPHVQRAVVSSERALDQVQAAPLTDTAASRSHAPASNKATTRTKRVADSTTAINDADTQKRARLRKSMPVHQEDEATRLGCDLDASYKRYVKCQAEYEEAVQKFKSIIFE